MTLPQVYPLVAWIAYFIGGMLLYEIYVSNTHHRANIIHWAVTDVSLVIAVVGLYFRFDPNLPGWLRFTGHTGVAGEIILSVAVAAIVLHMCLIVGKRIPTLVYPFAALGSMSLTVYILHVLTAYYWQQNVALQSTMWALGFVFFFLLIASLWKKFVGQGPFELLVSKVIKVIVPAEGKKV